MRNESGKIRDYQNYSSNSHFEGDCGFGTSVGRAKPIIVQRKLAVGEFALHDLHKERAERALGLSAETKVNTFTPQHCLSQDLRVLKQALESAILSRC
jgi:hypothetical protein